MLEFFSTQLSLVLALCPQSLERDLQVMPTLMTRSLPVTDFQQNCLLIWNPASREGSVIDPGGAAEWIFETIQKLGLNITQILLTHGHIDHVGGATQLAELLQHVPILGPHRADLFLLQGLQFQASLFGIDTVLPVTPTRFLEEGDHVTIGGISFLVRHTPGHTPGHIVFVQEQEKLAIVGDVLFKGSVGRTDLPGGSSAALKQSLREKILTLPDETVFFCGHGSSSTIGAERRTNPFLR